MKALNTETLELAYYHCRFFLPLYGLEASGFQPKPEHKHYYGSATAADMAAAQAWHYFTPALRDILFERQGPSRNHALVPLQEWRLPSNDISGWVLQLGEPGAADTHTLPIESVTLYRYFNSLYILSWHVSADTPMQMEQALHFTRLARVLFPSFTEQYDEGKIKPQTLMDNAAPNGQKILAQAFHQQSVIAWPASLGKQISPIVKYLLNCFATAAARLDGYFKTITQFYDDRLFISAAYGLAQEDLPQDTLRKIYSLAFHVDRHCDGFDRIGGHAYGPSELYPRLDEQTLWLWKEVGSYFGYSDAANIYLGSGNFFLHTIAPKHIPHIYDRMLLQALFYQATLRQFDQQLTEETPVLLTATDLDTIKNHRDKFIRFTNGYWFHNLTEQMQGKEIFHLQQQALGLQNQYAIIKDQLERTDEFVRIIDAKRNAETSDRITWWGGIFAIVSLWYAILDQLLSWWTDNHQSSLWSQLGQLPDNMQADPTLLGLVIGIVAIPLLLAAGWSCLLRWRK